MTCTVDTGQSALRLVAAPVSLSIEDARETTLFLDFVGFVLQED